MKQLWKSMILSIALQIVTSALQADSLLDTEELVMGRRANTNSMKSYCHHKRGPRGPQGPQGISGQPLNQYASFFMTQGSDGDLLSGQNFLFNNQVALSGIDYDSSTGVFTFGPGTYSVAYFYAPFTVELNLYVNGELIFNSPLGGSSTIFTVTEPINTLALQVMATKTFTAPPAGSSIASIALFRID